MAELIQPRLLKGFRDFLPVDERERQRVTDVLCTTFSSFGFEPIDTPILEYTEILLGKGGGDTDKQVYRFNDQGGRDVAMRYDLTVPFARYMALHLHELPIPFKRFHVAKVFRGENTQRGRYREFVQCDFDIVGTDSTSADFEIVLLMVRSFQAMGVSGVKIHLSHRGVFNSLLAEHGAAENSEEILRTVDKLRKIGEEKVQNALVNLVGTGAADTILQFIVRGKDNNETLSSMRELAPAATAETDRLEEVFAMAESLGISGSLVLDPSVTRGLDYYTGIVFETFLDEIPEIGSVCSGGRYDNLASLYTKQRLPGVGASIGLDRLMAGLQEINKDAAKAGAADAIVLATGSRRGDDHLVADALRGQGLRVEVYPDERKLAQQYTFAETKGIPAGVILPDGFNTGEMRLSVRDLSARTNLADLSIGQAAEKIREIAGR